MTTAGIGGLKYYTHTGSVFDLYDIPENYIVASLALPTLAFEPSEPDIVRAVLHGSHHPFISLNGPKASALDNDDTDQSCRDPMAILPEDYWGDEFRLLFSEDDDENLLAHDSPDGVVVVLHASSPDFPEIILQVRHQ